MITVELVIGLAFAVVGLASVIVKFTPSPKDDVFIKRVLDFMNKYLALNTSPTKFETEEVKPVEVTEIQALHRGRKPKSI